MRTLIYKISVFAVALASMGSGCVNGRRNFVYAEEGSDGNYKIVLVKQEKKELIEQKIRGPLTIVGCSPDDVIYINKQNYVVRKKFNGNDREVLAKLDGELTDDYSGRSVYMKKYNKIWLLIKHNSEKRGLIEYSLGDGVRVHPEYSGYEFIAPVSEDELLLSNRANSLILNVMSGVRAKSAIKKIPDGLMLRNGYIANEDAEFIYIRQLIDHSFLKRFPKTSNDVMVPYDYSLGKLLVTKINVNDKSQDFGILHGDGSIESYGQGNIGSACWIS